MLRTRFTNVLQHPAPSLIRDVVADPATQYRFNLLALGGSRAESVREWLLQQGVSADHIKTISYGKEKPFCEQDSEERRQQNRVDHFVFQR
jgi:peptidoglycan-associated lipoprotein